MAVSSSIGSNIFDILAARHDKLHRGRSRERDQQLRISVDLDRYRLQHPTRCPVHHDEDDEDDDDDGNDGGGDNGEEPATR